MRETANGSSGSFRRVLASAVLSGICAAATAQTYERLTSFRFFGQPAAALIQASDGHLYGTTRYGGTFGSGTVFQMTLGGTLTTIHSFDSIDGFVPQGSLFQAADGMLYGTTAIGGVAGLGNVFRIDTAGNLTVLHEFAGGASDGSGPIGNLIQAMDGNLYGTTGLGGANNLGTIFRIDSNDVWTIVHSFAGTDGSAPAGGLIQALDGQLYGLTAVGGTNGQGTIFKFSLVGVLTTLHSFSGADGSAPVGSLEDGANGWVYGATGLGGANGVGTVFRVDESGGFESLHDFQFLQGGSPYDGLTRASDGNFYGTTGEGGIAPGPNGGTIYKITPSGTFTSLHSLSNIEGETPFATVVQASDGLLYGVSAGPAFPTAGTVWRSTLDGTLTVIHAFEYVEGVLPRGIIRGTDGNFYGTTQHGGPGGDGTVFRVDSAGNLATLHTFTGLGDDGLQPFQDTVIQGSDGDFYGTTIGGGSESGGTVFKTSTSGATTTLHSFSFDDGDGLFPTSIMQAADGTFYGTTGQGGASTNGIIFSMTSAGVVTTVHEFTGAIGEGAEPYARLLEGPDGSLYGTTYGGGAGGAGTVFKIDPSGLLTTLHGFAGGPSDGSDPFAALVLGADGAFYGTTQGGGASGKGTVFRVDSTGDYSVVHSFAGPPTEGAIPSGALTLTANGILYGTTMAGGANNRGSIFKIDTAGTLSTIFSFTFRDGSQPIGALVQSPDGWLYGTGILGGPGFGGVLFRFSPSAPATVAAIMPTSGIASGGTAVTVSGAGFLNGLTLAIGGVPATGVVVEASTSVTGVAPALPPGTLNDVTVVNAAGIEDATAGTLPGAFFADFLDVPQADIFHGFVETVFRAGITAGCGGGLYCRDNPVTRAQMAVFLLKAEHGAAYDPPDCVGVFPDVPCTPGSGFSDWIEQLAAENITGGCGGGNYCPGSPVTRQQMAVFLLKTEHGAAYVPPVCGGVFGDVACPSLFADWIERLYAEGVTGGCSATPLLYCPGGSVTRGQMAVFLVRTFDLP